MARRERTRPTKPEKTLVRAEHDYAHAIVVKLQEGTRVRTRGGKFAFDPSTLDEDDKVLLKRARLTEHEIDRQVKELNRLIERPRLDLQRMFPRDEDTLEKEKRHAEEQANEEIADPNLYVYVVLEDATPDESSDIIDRLNQ